MRKFLDYYIEKFKKIKRDIDSDGHLAPHCPILLFSLIGATIGDSSRRNSYSSQGLISLFQQVWNGLQPSLIPPADVTKPFFDLVSEGILHLNKSKSNGISEASVDPELFDYMSIEKGSRALIQTILDTYFWDRKEKWETVEQIIFRPHHDQNNSMNHSKQVASQDTCRVNQRRNGRKGSAKKILRNRKKKQNIAQRQNYGELEDLDLPLSCVRILYENFKIRTVRAFVEFDINKIRRCHGIGIRKIAMLSEKQKYWTKHSNEKNDQKAFHIAQLDLLPSCVAALSSFKIKTVEDFCKFNIDRLNNTPGIGKRKLESIRIIQQKLQEKYHITVEKKDLLEGDLSDSLSNFPRKSPLSYTPVEILNKTIGDIFVFPDGIETIGKIPFNVSVSRLLCYGGFYSFDDIYTLQVTTLEYFQLLLGDTFPEFWSVLNICAQNTKIPTFCIADKTWSAQYNDSLFIPALLLAEKDYKFLKDNQINTFSDYADKVLEHCSIMDSNSLGLARFHSENFARLRQYCDGLKQIEHDPMIAFFTDHEQRSVTIYKMRYCDNKTLDRISTEVSRTRERIRQITKDLDEALINEKDYFNVILSPVTTVFLFINTFFMANKGVIACERIKQIVLKTFGWEEYFFDFVKHFLEICCNCSAFSDSFYILESCPCLSCLQLKETIRKDIFTKKSLDRNEQLFLTNACCNGCVHNITSHSAILQENLTDFLFVFYEKNMQDEVVLNTDGTLYSESEYAIHFGSHREIVEGLFEKKKILSIDEIVSELSKYRPEMTERKAHGYIQGADLVLADRGKYMLRSSLPDIPLKTVNMVVKDIQKKISKNPNGLFSVGITLKKFFDVLAPLGCCSAYILFEILKQKHPEGIRFIKCPYVTSNVNNGRFSISDLLEDYMNDVGIAPLASVREHFINELGISAPVFSLAYSSSDRLLVDDDNNLLSTEELGIEKDMLLPFEKQLSNLGATDSITAKKLFTDNKAICLMLNIGGPKLLFNVLKIYESDLFSFRFPQISKSKENFVAIKKMVIDFIRKSGSFCTVDQLEDFCAQKHLSGRNLYFPHSSYPELFCYHPGAWVHIDTIGWKDDWLDTVCSLAKRVLKESTSPQQSFDYLDSICDREDELPEIQNGLWWTSTLVGDILESSGEFLVYGKNKSIFSLKKMQPNNLTNFGDLCALLLDSQFDGAANLHDFSNYLRDKNLISNCDLHDSLLQGSKRIVISDHEVYTEKEPLNAY